MCHRHTCVPLILLCPLSDLGSCLQREDLLPASFEVGSTIHCATEANLPGTVTHAHHLGELLQIHRDLHDDEKHLIIEVVVALLPDFLWHVLAKKEIEVRTLMWQRGYVIGNPEFCSNSDALSLRVENDLTPWPKSLWRIK